MSSPPLTGGGPAHSIHVLTVDHDAISTVTLFVEPRLFEAFGLPPILPDSLSPASRPVRSSGP
jgi:hypothetical protein